MDVYNLLMIFRGECGIIETWGEGKINRGLDFLCETITYISFFKMKR